MNLLLALTLSTAFADYPWLKKLAVCNAAVAGLDGRSGVMRFEDGAATEKQKDVGSIYLGETGSAFVGENGKRAGLWVVTERQAYFVDMEKLPADTKQKGSGTWNLKIRMRGRPALHSAFGYFDQAEGPKKWRILTAAFDTEQAPLGEQQKATQEVEAREYVTPELQKQMEEKIMSTLTRWRNMIAPNGEAVTDPGALEFLRSLEAREKKSSKNAKPEPSAVTEIENREFDREGKMAKAMTQCQKALGGEKEFSSITGMINLVQRHLATKHQLNIRSTDDIKSDTSL